ncbi:MAG: hypothetical protein ACOYL5_09500 [Phototrophicaceae bacterium]
MEEKPKRSDVVYVPSSVRWVAGIFVVIFGLQILRGTYALWQSLEGSTFFALAWACFGLLVAWHLWRFRLWALNAGAGILLVTLVTAFAREASGANTLLWIVNLVMLGILLDSGNRRAFRQLADAEAAVDDPVPLSDLVAAPMAAYSEEEAAKFGNVTEKAKRVAAEPSQYRRGFLAVLLAFPLFCVGMIVLISAGSQLWFGWQAGVDVLSYLFAPFALGGLVIVLLSAALWRWIRTR